MAQIININLGGRSIPIEDTAYTKIQNYIAGVRTSFANTAGLEEIVSEVESRFSDFMHSRLNTGAPFINEFDVDAMIGTMGRPEDFKSTAGTVPGNTAGFYDTTRRLYRNEANKVFGGVCSGIANWMNVDPTLIRVLFAIVTLGGFGTGLLIYIILWIALPTKNLYGYTGKRIFRNTDNKVLGGVCSGIATYFGKDVSIVRLIFAFPLVLAFARFLFRNLHFYGFHGFFFGSWTMTFLLIYIILWIILPEPRSMYEKMEMYGKPVGLDSIRDNVEGSMGAIKDRMQSWGKEVQESAQKLGAKAGSLGNEFGSGFKQGTNPNINPNQMYNPNYGNSFGSSVGRGAASIAGVIATIIKVIFYVIFGLFIAASLVAFLSILFSGVATSTFANFAFTSEDQKMLAWGTYLLFIGAPIIGAAIWLGRRILNIRTPGNYLRWLFGGLWTIGWFCLIFFLSSMSSDFKRKESAEVPVAIHQPPNGKLLLTVSQPRLEYDNAYNWLDNGRKMQGFDITNDTLKLSDVGVNFSKSTDSLYHVIIEKQAMGRSTEEAKGRLNKIQYAVNANDTVLDLANGFAIDKGSKYRVQKVIVNVQVPVGKKIILDPSVHEKLKYFNVQIEDGPRNSVRIQRTERFYQNGMMSNVEYTMNENGSLQSPEDKSQTVVIRAEDNFSHGSDSVYRFEAPPTAPAPPAAPIAPQAPGDSSFRFEAPAVAIKKDTGTTNSEILKQLEQKEKEIQELKKKLRQ